MKRVSVANPGLWGMENCLADCRAGNPYGSNGAPITDVVIKRIHDAVRILSLKKKLKPAETFSREHGGEMAGRRLPRSNSGDGKGGLPRGWPRAVAHEALARPIQSMQRSEQS